MTRIGDTIYFKYGVEMEGELVKIDFDNQMLHIENQDGFYGGYAEGETIIQMEVDRCWDDNGECEIDENSNYPILEIPVTPGMRDKIEELKSRLMVDDAEAVKYAILSS